MELTILLVVVGLAGGLLAGWLGLGGGIILAPLLLVIPSALGLSPLDMKEVARLTIFQSLCSTAAAGWAHRRAGHVQGPLVVWMGTLIAAASVSGAWISEREYVSSELLLGLFATMALGARTSRAAPTAALRILLVIGASAVAMWIELLR